MISPRIQLLLLAILALLAITVTYSYDRAQNTPEQRADIQSIVSTESGAATQSVPLQNTKRDPQRKWEVLDPTVDAEAMIVQSLDTHFPFFTYQSFKQWPIASISKLISAVVVAEEFGYKKQIHINQSAIDTEGVAGDLLPDEVYSAEDLVKIMLLTSSNDAATAFEEYAGGREKFAGLLEKKIKAIGMTQTTMSDASGLSDENKSTANDLLKLLRYLIEHHPEIIEWTRLQNYLVQPINTGRTHTVYNIDVFVNDSRFLGGKTGTTPTARENLLALFNVKGERLALIIFGSHNRKGEIEMILNWIRTAYIFN